MTGRAQSNNWDRSPPARGIWGEYDQVRERSSSARVKTAIAGLRKQVALQQRQENGDMVLMVLMLSLSVLLLLLLHRYSGKEPGWNTDKRRQTERDGYRRYDRGCGSGIDGVVDRYGSFSSFRWSLQWQIRMLAAWTAQSLQQCCAVVAVSYDTAAAGALAFLCYGLWQFSYGTACHDMELSSI